MGIETLQDAVSKRKARGFTNELLSQGLIQLKQASWFKVWVADLGVHCRTLAGCAGLLGHRGPTWTGLAAFRFNFHITGPSVAVLQLVQVAGSGG